VEILNADYIEMDQPLGGGSMYSTVGDLLRWDRALYTEKLVSRKSLQQIFTPNETVYSATRPLDRGWYSRHKYGYGWDIAQRWFGRRLYSHAGGINGFQSMIMRYPEDRTLVVVLTNMESPEVQDGDLMEERTIIANGLSAISFGLPPNSNPVSGKGSGTNWQQSRCKLYVYSDDSIGRQNCLTTSAYAGSGHSRQRRN
jgi:CubicO group peptidase (beta-lactamase class C family)